MTIQPRAVARRLAPGVGDCAAGAVTLLLVLLALTAAARAESPQPDEAWIGARVMARDSGTKLKIGSDVTAVISAGSVFRTERVRGDWLWVDSGNIRGWVKKDAVVPFEQAIVHFTEVLRRDPGNVHALVNRGLVRHANRDYEGAIADDTEALRHQPDQAWAYHNRASAYLARGELARALVDADASIKLEPGEPSHRANRASIAFASKAYDQAIADYSDAIARLKGGEALLDDSADDGQPGQNSGRLCRVKWTAARAECWAAKHALDRAIADYDEARRVDPADYATLNSLSWLLATCSDSHYRDAKKAVSLALQACELTSYRNHLCLDTLAAACAEGGDYAVAVRWLTRAIDLTAGDRRFLDNYLARLILFLNRMPYHQGPAA